MGETTAEQKGMIALVVAIILSTVLMWISFRPSTPLSHGVKNGIAATVAILLVCGSCGLALYLIFYRMGGPPHGR